MRIPVLLATPATPALRKSAAALASRQLLAPRVGNLPAGVQIDATFPAIPIGPGDTGVARSLSALTPTASKAFLVRALIDVPSPDAVPSVIGRRQVFADPRIETFQAPRPHCGNQAVGSVVDVEQRLNVAALHARGLDGTDVAVAIVDGGIDLAYLRAKLGRMPRFDAANSWTPPTGGRAPGTYGTGHGTMCAHAALIAAPRATLLDFPVLAFPAPGGGSSMSGTLSTAVLAYAQLLAGWAVGFAAGGTAAYQGLVVSNSWGVYHPSWDFPAGHPGRYVDNPNHPFTLLVGVLDGAGADIVFAAGNCGANCPDGRCQGRIQGTIMGANAAASVLCVAGCDVNRVRIGYSSQGPAIANMPHDKPDLGAYTHFVGSEVYGVGAPDDGTSTACPVAAGCIAAVRTKVAPSTKPPSSMRANLRTAAGGAWNADLGWGIIDPDTTAQMFGV